MFALRLCPRTSTYTPNKFPGVIMKTEGMCNVQNNMVMDNIVMD